MNVLIISRYFWPEDGVSEEPYILKEYLDWHLSQHHNIEVVSGTQNHYMGDLSKYKKLRVKFSYFISSIDRRSSFSKRILNSLILLLLASKSVIFKRRFDIIYLPSNPPFLALFIVVINKIFFKKSKIIFMIQDNMIYRINNKLLKWIYKKNMKYTLAMSSINIVLSQPMKDEILSYFTKSESNKISKKIHVLLNFTNLDENVHEKNIIFSERVIDIIYAGNHGKSQSLINFLKIIKEINPVNRPRILFYGEGEDKLNILNYSKKHKLGINFHNAISKNDIIKKISESKYGLVCMSEPLSRYAFPSKLATYVSSGTKVILCVNGNDHLSNYIKSKGFGFVIDSSDPRSAASNLRLHLQDNADLCSNFIENANLEFNKENYFKRFNKIFKDVVK